MFHLRTTFAGALIALGLIGTSTGMAAGIDPYKVEAMTSPAPNQAWTPNQPLPTLTRPDKAPTVPAQFKGPLSLADLTDLALLMNPRTRQAWLSARAEAAAMGIENADDWPTITGLYSHRIGRLISSTTGRSEEHTSELQSH